MQLTVLGSGTIAGEADRNCSGYLVDRRVLLECGPGIWRSLDRAGGLVREVHTVVISHFHVDHVADLIPILWARYVLEIDQTRPLAVYGPRGLRRWFSKLARVHRQWLASCGGFELREISGPTELEGGYTIRALPTLHTPESVCCRLTDSRDKTLFYSGDTGWNDNLIRLADSCDVAIIEAAVPSAREGADHLSPRQAGQVAHGARARMLMLTHLYPEVLRGDPVSDAAQEYGGRIEIARDGLVLDL